MTSGFDDSRDELAQDESCRQRELRREVADLERRLQECAAESKELARKLRDAEICTGCDCASPWMPNGDEALCGDCTADRLKSKIQESEAGAAAMREALELGLRDVRCAYIEQCGECFACHAHNALASDAGREWLEHMRALERDRFIGPCAHGRDPYDRCELCQDLSPSQAERRAVLEDASKVADLVDGSVGDYLGFGAYIARAIRALAKEGT